MPENLEQLEQQALTELAAAAGGDALEKWKQAYLGSSGRVKAALADLKNVPKEQRPEYGKKANALSGSLAQALEARRGALGLAGANGEAEGAPKQASGLDVTEPALAWSMGAGRRHIITRVRDELVEVFARMGFEAAAGPELEDDEHNFIKLNIPPAHPARDPIDNFYIDEPLAEGASPRMLRSQTSTVQIRVMETRKPPIRVVAPGRVYRPDTVDATHSFMFHQIEGLCVDRGVTMADLKSCLFHFARSYFGSGAEVRLRPSYFPFTEPSAEFDLKISLREGQPAKWMELGGCGMVDPAVLTQVGIDPEEYSGFAFGFGIERLAMGKYGIPDIRMLYENDLRFLRQV